LNILLAASEVFPYAKTGGLADVAGALPKALVRLGHRVRVIMPRYNLDRIMAASESLPGQLEVPFAVGTRSSAVYVDRSAEVPVYFVDAHEYFGRGKLYGEHDDAERFAYFSRAVIEFAKSLGERLDVIHLNDWMTGLVPAYLRTVYANDPALAGVGSVFTIHNLAFPGFFDAGLLPRIGLPEGIFRADGGIEFYGQASAMKAGLIFSDAITTVSPRYSREIQTPELGERFDGLLRVRAGQLYGILNGVDYEEWSPDTDSYTVAGYSAADLSGKAECKRDLLRSFNLPEDLDKPLIGCISRLSDQKGFDLILDIADRMLDRGIAFVLLGSGAEFYERAFQSLHDARPTQVGVYLGYSNELAHKIEAGSDMFLMPSRFEPCGLNQMYSLRYGTVPIVRAAGGLDDTIDNFDRTTKQGTGFKFYEYDSTRLLEKIYEALLVYADRGLWRTLIMNGMRADHSWDASARQYVDVYEKTTRPSAAASGTTANV
jgi:starch synthase